MLVKFFHYIQYHNSVAIGMAVLFLGAGFAAASPAARDAVYSSSQIARSVDNGYIRQVDLGSLRFGLKINRVTEDSNAYIVDYSYNTIVVNDYMWQPVFLEKTLNVSKQALGERDLGMYVAEQLGQIIDRDYSYLSRAQTIEREKGPSQKIITTQYAGLVGRMLDPKDKVFAGYDPVVKPPQAEQEEKKEPEVLARAEEQEQVKEVVKEVVVRTEVVADRDTIQNIVMEYLTQHGTASAAGAAPLANSDSSPQASSSQENASAGQSIAQTVPLPSDTPAAPSAPEPQSSSVSVQSEPIQQIQSEQTIEESVFEESVPAVETVTGAQNGVQP